MPKENCTPKPPICHVPSNQLRQVLRFLDVPTQALFTTLSASQLSLPPLD